MHKNTIYKNRKHIAVRIGYIAACVISSGAIVWGLIQMAGSAPVPALVAMSGVAALSFIRHDINVMLRADVKRRS